LVITSFVTQSLPLSGQREAAKEEGKVRGTRKKKENLILLTEPLE
jgi:hypothetical protein